MFTAQPRSWRLGPACIVAGLAIALHMAVACGQDAGAPGVITPAEQAFQKVTALDDVYTTDDLLAAGARKSKEYDVDGLTAATDAWFGWWQPAGSTPFDIEVRFYQSHGDAVEYGTPFADEASGKDAVLDSNDATWKGDVRDRRSVIGGVRGGVASSGTGPRYGDYAIFANMVVLCEGTTSDHSLERCESLISALRVQRGE